MSEDTTLFDLDQPFVLQNHQRAFELLFAHTEKLHDRVGIAF